MLFLFGFHNTFSLLWYIIRDTFLLTMLTTDDEKNILHMMLKDKESGYRAKIILLKDEGYIVPQIRKITNHHMIAT